MMCGRFIEISAQVCAIWLAYYNEFPSFPIFTAVSRCQKGKKDGKAELLRGYSCGMWAG